jgi:hypothetical protein
MERNAEKRSKQSSEESWGKQEIVWTEELGE